ncbi:MAG: F0F1 ATP synthase subunit A [Symbiobacteriia bacterium]
MNSMYWALAEEGAKKTAEPGALAVIPIHIPGLLPEGLEITSRVTTMWGIMAFLLLLGWLASRNMKRAPRGVQNVMEMMVEAVQGIIGGVLDRERTLQFTPLLTSIFLFILISNYVGLLPGAGHLPGFAAPTSGWGVNAGLAIIVFSAVQIYGIKKNGIAVYKHMVEPIFLAPLMLPLGILEEIIRPFTLSIRLYANIFAGEMVVLAMTRAIPYFLPIAPLLLELIFGAIQAFIFTLLSAVYISAATEDHKHHGHEEGASGAIGLGTTEADALAHGD